MTAYYNEIDPKAAAWLRELIKQGHIADGVVDERSIVDVTPDELRGFTQCHFFAGIGVWSYALRSAGWADDRPVWTGSCPCQPFSSAGRRGGVDDERHLWPHWHHLISQCQPSVVFGEQVASKDGLGWLDLVSTDMEATGYAFGAADLCAAGVGAPHIRQRLFFGAVRLADASGAGQQAERAGSIRDGQQFEAVIRGSASGLANADDKREVAAGDGAGAGDTGRAGFNCGLADAASAGPLPGPHGRVHRGEEGSGPRDAEPERSRPNERLADADSARIRDSGCGVNEEAARGMQNKEQQRERLWSDVGADGGDGSPARPSPTNGHWRDADWLFCRDGKWRPVEPGTFPLAHGSTQRVGRLRGYGNAIVAQAAQTFIESMMEIAE